MKKLLSIALIAALIVSVTPLMGINGVNDSAGVAYATEEIPIDEDHFPDANFRAFLTKEYGSSFDPTSVCKLDVQCNHIASLEGIQYFTSLEILYCSTNYIDSLDLSYNTALVELWCDQNNLSSLDLSHNTALKYLKCCINMLSSLDVSHNTALEYLDCQGNLLNNLDLSHNTALEYLYCNGNKLRSLNLGNNDSLYEVNASDNNLRSLDVSHNPGLFFLYCTNNNLGKLYVGNGLPDHCYHDEGVEIIYGEGPGEGSYTYGIGDFVIGRDSNNFCNAGTSRSNALNDCGYEDKKFCELLDYKYYKQLQHFESEGDLAVWNAVAHKFAIANMYWNEKPKGICYAVAATMSMLKSGALELGVLTDGNATSYYQLGSPVDDHKFGQMIYYYMLSECSSIKDLAKISSTNKKKDGVSGFSKTLVSVLQQYDKPYLISNKDHTWIVTEVETNPDGSYTVEMFDENLVFRSKDEEDPRYSKNGRFTYMNISPDFESLSFTESSGKKYDTDEDGEIYYIDDKGEKCTDNIWLSDPDKSAPHKMSSLKNEPLAQNIQNIWDKCDAISFWNNNSISLTNSKGEKMSYDADEELISGDMEIEDISTINYGENNYKYIVYVPKSSSYRVDTQNSDIDISLFSKENIIAIKGTNINNITLDSDLNAVVEGGSGGYTFDIASTVKNENNDIGLDLINISGDASDKLKVTNTTESFGIQSDSILDKANVVIHSDNNTTESNLDKVTTIDVKAGSNITSDASTSAPVDPTPVDPAASSKTAIGTTHKVGGNTFEVLSANTVAFTKAKNKKSVTVPATVMIDDKTFNVVQVNPKAFAAKKIRTVTIGKNVKTIRKNAFSKSKATKMVIKTRMLTKKTVKGSLKNSKIKTVQVKAGKKKENKKYIKKYKKIFTKKNAGKKVTVK